MNEIVVDPFLARGVPRTVSMRQAEQALHAAGLLEQVEAVIAAADRSAQIDWKRATEINRDWPLLLQLQPVLGWTDQQIDDLFIDANKR